MIKVDKRITDDMCEHDEYIFLHPTVTGKSYETIKCGKTEEYVGRLYYKSDGWFIDAKDPLLYYFLIVKLFSF